MPSCARIRQAAESDHEDFAVAIAAIESDSDQDDHNTGPGPILLETNYIPPEPGPHANDDELREVSSLVLTALTDRSLSVKRNSKLLICHSSYDIRA
jgi:hypothetical protein